MEGVPLSYQGKNLGGSLISHSIPSLSASPANAASRKLQNLLSTSIVHCLPLTPRLLQKPPPLLVTLMEGLAPQAIRSPQTSPELLPAGPHFLPLTPSSLPLLFAPRSHCFFLCFQNRPTCTILPDVSSLLTLYHILCFDIFDTEITMYLLVECLYIYLWKVSSIQCKFQERWISSDLLCAPSPTPTTTLGAQWELHKYLSNE